MEIFRAAYDYRLHEVPEDYLEQIKETAAERGDNKLRETVEWYDRRAEEDAPTLQEMIADRVSTEQAEAPDPRNFRPESIEYAFIQVGTVLGGLSGYAATAGSSALPEELAVVSGGAAGALTGKAVDVAGRKLSELGEHILED